MIWDLCKALPFHMACICGIGACPATDGKGPGDGPEPICHWKHLILPKNGATLFKRWQNIWRCRR